MRLFIGRKRSEYYKGLLIKADLGLHDQIASKVVASIPKGARILDLGAGEGALSARLCDLGYKVVAADKDQESFKCADAQFARIDFDSPEDINLFVLRHVDTFDVVLGVEVIEHVRDQWQYVNQLIKMAKPGALILITTPNTGSWLSRVLFLFTGRFHQFGDGDLSYGHINPISPWELELVLRESGAENIEIVAAGTLPPVYISGINRLLPINAFALLLRPLMRGLLDGWCVMVTARKAN